MGRTARFQRDDIVRATLRLASDRGPAAVTIAAVANEVGAPTGSIYHRYASREQLLAEVWLEAVERFQGAFVATLAEADDVAGGAKAARLMALWPRKHPLEARLLLLHHRSDFVSDEWPAALAERAAALEPQLGAAMRDYARRVLRRAPPRDTAVVLRYALLDAPFGGIKPYVQSGKPIPTTLEEAIELTARAVLTEWAER